MKRKKEKFGIYRIIISFLILSAYMFLITPGSYMSFIVFYFLVFLFIHSLTRFFYRDKRSIIYSLVLCIYLFLLQQKIAQPLNLAILISIIATVEIYFRKT